MPLSFPNLSQIQNSPDGSDISPSDRTFAHRKMYGDIGKGRPAVLLSRGGGGSPGANPQTQLPVRRSSSGTFSSSSSSEGSVLGTPTKLVVPRTCDIFFKFLEAHPIIECRVPGRSPALQAGKNSMKRPAYNRHNTYERGYQLTPRRSFGVLPRPLTEHERPNKFEANFVTIDILGTGEFGSALEVRYKQGNGHDVFAIKKSKSFEGVKHR